MRAKIEAALDDGAASGADPCAAAEHGRGQVAVREGDVLAAGDGLALLATDLPDRAAAGRTDEIMFVPLKQRNEEKHEILLRDKK